MTRWRERRQNLDWFLLISAGTTCWKWGENMSAWELAWLLMGCIGILAFSAAFMALHLENKK